jgi:hypothetical protein
MGQNFPNCNVISVAVPHDQIGKRSYMNRTRGEGTIARSTFRWTHVSHSSKLHSVCEGHIHCSRHAGLYNSRAFY